MLLAAPAHATNIVLEGDFEVAGFFWNETDWFFNRGNGVHSGLFDALSACPGDSCADTALLSQTLTTVAGQSYDLSFWLYTDGLFPNVNSSPNELKVRWGGSVVDDILNFPSTNPSSTAYSPGGPPTLIEINGLIATSTSTEISFGGRDEPAGIYIDDVCVDNSGGACTLDASAAVTTPEPGSFMLLASGLLGVGRLLRRRPLSR